MNIDHDNFKFLYAPRAKSRTRSKNDLTSEQIAADVEKFIKEKGVIYQAKLGETAYIKEDGKLIKKYGKGAEIL